MYNSSIVSQRIKESARKNNIRLKDLLKECGLGINTISQMKTGNVISSEGLYKIADYLGVSIDYLTGRTDNPEVNK